MFTTNPLRFIFNPKTSLLTMKQGLGGKGFLVRTPEELAQATKEAFHIKDVPTVINVLIDRAPASKLVRLLLSLLYMQVTVEIMLTIL